MHFDLMLQVGDALATWQLAQLPTSLAVGQSLPATQLPDHRLAYLDYEGPVSRGRGSVRIAQAGTWRGERTGPGSWVFSLHGQHVTADFALRQLHGRQWELSRLPESAPPES